MKYSKLALTIILLSSSHAFSQDGINTVVYSGAVSVGVAGAAVGALDRAPGGRVQGAPYTATITNESVQTLADGNRIVQTSSGNTARDSQGRTRQDTVLPAIGNLQIADVPHLVFIMDPVAQISYTLDLTGKTAQKMPMFFNVQTGPGGPGADNTFFIQRGATVAGAPLPPLPPPPQIALSKPAMIAINDGAELKTDDLGFQTMEGVVVSGMRTARTIPAGRVGNDRPIEIVSEVWTSPDLKTVVYSKRNDPRTGEQTFRLTNITRAEPDASLFTVPSDFKISEGPQPIIYRANQQQ